MTINKIGISALAASVLVSVVYAGTITTAGTTSKIGKEQLSLTDINVSNVTGQARVSYTPTAIPAGSLKNPIFKFTFTNAKSLVDSSANGLGVFQVLDGNESNTTQANYTLVGKTATVSGANSEVVSFNASSASTYVYNNKKYVIRDINATGTGTNVIATDENLTATVVKGSTASVTISAGLYSGDSQALNDSANAATIYTVATEYTGAINTKFNARIDAAATFYKFYDQNIDGTLKVADQLQATITKATGFIAGGILSGVTNALIIYPDQNLTKNAIAATSTGTVSGLAKDTNITVTALTAGVKEDVNLTVNGTTEIKKTTFDATLYVQSASTKFTLVAKSTGNAGIWTIYGYNAQIPNVSGLSTHNTTMKFTNRSSLNTNIYFTLIDPDGTVATLNSVDNTSLASLNAGVTGTYKASDLVALITDTNFDATGSFSVEVSIPTTPSSVYGMASFKNTTLGQFKDLPVYNSSTMTY